MLLTRVQAHPARSELLPKLIQSLSPLRTEISLHSSQPPNPWEGYKQALTGIPEKGHVLVLQDDVQVCQNFAAAVEQIAVANPEYPVVLFLAKAPQRIAGLAIRAAKKRQPYIHTQLRINEFMPVVSVLWPCNKAREFMSWASTAKLPGYPRVTLSDDACAGRWASVTKQTICFTVPSLVEHRIDVDSLVGNNRKGARVALLFEESDPLERNWSI